MDTILKFAALGRQDPAAQAGLSLDAQSQFQNDLRELSASAQPRRDAVARAQQFVDESFLSQTSQVARGDELFNFVIRLQGAPLPPVADVAADLRAILGNVPARYASDSDFARDSVLARYLIAEGPDSDVAQTLARGYGVADAVLSGTPTRNQLQAIVSGPIAIPHFLPPLLARVAAESPAATPAERAEALATEINTLSLRHENLAATLAQFQYHAEDELDLSERGERKRLIEFYRKSVPAHPRAVAIERRAGDEPKPPAPSPAENQVISPLLRAADGRNVLFSTETVDILPTAVKRTLAELDLDVTTETIGDMYDRVMVEHVDVGRQLRTMSGTFANMTGVVSVMPHIDVSKWVLDPVDAPEVPVPTNTAAPSTHVPVKPLGVADLLLVRTHIVKYEKSEVSYIENIIAHEKLTHELRRLDRTESTTTDESESTDLQSQAQTIAETDNSHTGVQAVGPGIGPVTAEGPSTFAQSVTDQVSSSSTRRTRRLAELRQIRESEETQQHMIGNSTGNAATYGVYQWLDKLYSAQTYNYGSRLLYDIVVPEPAAVFREAFGRPRSGIGLPTRPAKFTLDPSKLNVENWSYYATGHRATGVDAPPAEYVVVTEPFAGKSKDQFSWESVDNTVIWAEARSTRIPRGYHAVRYRARVSAYGYPEGWVRVSVGGHSFTVGSGSHPKSGKLDKEIETIPVAVHVGSNGYDWGVLDFTVCIEIICEATEESVSAWQVKSHGAILEANRRRFEEYEEAVANRDAAARIFLQSLTPARKATIVSTEMKRAALEVLTNQNFTGFNANKVDAMGFPYPYAPAVTGLSAYIRFFEHAVEWDRLAYAFHPYFWGAQASWVSKLVSAEPDPDFARFLTSGSARVIVPIRPGFEESFERFTQTGSTPSTDEQLDVGGPLWVSLVNDLRGQDGDDDVETPVGDPWRFRVASDLVRARPDGSMPKWALEQGIWSESVDNSFS